MNAMYAKHSANAARDTGRSSAVGAADAAVGGGAAGASGTNSAWPEWQSQIMKNGYKEPEERTGEFEYRMTSFLSLDGVGTVPSNSVIA